MSLEGSEEGRIIFTLIDQPAEQQELSLWKTTSITLRHDDWKWTGHPSADIDIAMLPFICSDHLDRSVRTRYGRCIQTDIVPKQNEIADFDAIDDVLFVGYPSGIYDQVNHVPISRKGITATPLALDYEGKPIVLIDASVFPGSSGSPVFIYKSGDWTTRKGEIRYGPSIFLVGVLSGGFFCDTDGSIKLEDIPTSVMPTVNAQEMIDLGVVYKARTVVETIEHLIGELVKRRASGPAQPRPE